MARKEPPIDLKDLANRSDPESRDTFLTAYGDLTDPTRERFFRARAEEVRATLDGDDAAGFDAAWARVEKALGQARGGKGVAVFVSVEHDLERVHVLAERVANTLVLDSSPYVRPLARFLDEYESFVLTYLDGDRAVVFLVDEAKAERTGGVRSRLGSRHKSGGWSQMRYQRHRQGAADRYFQEVADRIDALFQAGEAEQLVIAGPGTAKKQLEGRLSPRAKEALVAVEDADADEEGDVLVARFLALMRAVEAEESAAAVEALRGALRHGELAVAGPFATARAARDGRVDLLVVRKGHQAGGAKCEEHQSLFERGKACTCGNKGTPVDLLNEAVRYATRSDSRIEFVDDAEGFVRGVGGVAALLRW